MMRLEDKQQLGDPGSCAGRSGGHDNSSPNSNRRGSSSNSQPNSNSGSRFYADLTDGIRTQSFVSFRNCVLIWLGAKGYQDICVLRRKAARGRRRIGGADFVATSPYEPNVRVAVQIRHWQTPVQRRVVDELWGFTLRQGIPQGLIITNGRFSSRARAAVLEYPGRPIQLVSACQLAGSMAGLGLGVELIDGREVVSEAFFRTIDSLSIASSLASALEPPKAHPASPTRRSGCLDSVSSGPPSKPDGFNQRGAWFLLLLLALLVAAWLMGGRR